MRTALRILFATALVAAPVERAYEYYLAGNSADVETKTTPGLLLEGGGKDVDAAFGWFIAKAGGGDVVVLRASGGDGYNAYLRSRGRTDSVETLLIKSRAGASDPFVVDKVRRAEALFFAGGDQWKYVERWKGTPLKEAIHQLVSRGVPIGGTSAGLAILGEYCFSAQNDTITSAEALDDPYHPKATLETGFLSLPHMTGVLTDSHFAARDRMGRLVSFLARLRAEGKIVKGIGVDEKAAVLVEEDGEARVVGHDAAYLVSLQEAPMVCTRGRPLTVRNVSISRIPAGGRFNLETWTSVADAYTLNSEAGVLSSSTRSVY